MNTRGATLTSRMAVLFAFLFAITACGGGGSGDNFYDGDDSSSSGLQLALYDPQGNSTKTVTTSAPGTLKVTVKGKGSGVVVTARTDIGLLFPISGTALTDGNGVATFQVEAGPARGAGTLSASAEVDDTAVEGKLGFGVGESGLRLGYFDDDGMFVENAILIEPESTLAAGGNAQLSVVILDSEGKRVTTAESVRFNSGCIAAGQATVNPGNPVTSVNAAASTLYTATGCSGIDDITASLVGAAAQAFGSLTVASAQANAVHFVSAEPTLIVLKGTGGTNREETSEVVFKIVDSTGAPLQGVLVDFSLTTEIGGLSLSTPSSLSGGDGQAKVTVSSGDIATTVRVIATVGDGSGNPVSTVSDLLIVTTGLPDQDSISLSVSESFVVENGMTVDGLTRDITVAMADKFNNPVVDGTSAVFTTEYGSIIGSCTTLDGTCSVQWRTQAPRYPLLTGDVQTIGNGNSCPCAGDMGYTRGGRSTIIVRAQGEESFIDRNGNGIMDEDEKHLFENLPEAFIDNNEDGVYTPGLASCISSPQGSAQCIAGLEEEFFDYNNNQIYDNNDDPAVYNGLLCPPEGDGVWCSRSLVEVRAQTVVTLSYNHTWVIKRLGSTALVADRFNSPPREGSTINVEVKEGDCEILSEEETTVPNISGYNSETGLGRNGAFGVNVVTAGTGTYSIILNPQGGTPVSNIYTCAGGLTDPNDP